MKKVIILMGEAYYEGSYIIKVFSYNELSKIMINIEDVKDMNSIINSEDRWKKVFRKSFIDKYCNGFDSYHIDIRDIIEV